MGFPVLRSVPCRIRKRWMIYIGDRHWMHYMQSVKSILFKRRCRAQSCRRLSMNYTKWFLFSAYLFLFNMQNVFYRVFCLFVYEYFLLCVSFVSWLSLFVFVVFSETIVFLLSE